MQPYLELFLADDNVRSAVRKYNVPGLMLMGSINEYRVNVKAKKNVGLSYELVGPLEVHK